VLPLVTVAQFFRTRFSHCNLKTFAVPDTISDHLINLLPDSSHRTKIQNDLAEGLGKALANFSDKMYLTMHNFLDTLIENDELKGKVEFVRLPEPEPNALFQAVLEAYETTKPPN
jgi:hypothetical protein